MVKLLAFLQKYSNSPIGLQLLSDYPKNLNNIVKNSEYIEYSERFFGFFVPDIRICYPFLILRKTLVISLVVTTK